MVGMMEALDHELCLAGYDGIFTTTIFPSSINTSLYARSRHLYLKFIKLLKLFDIYSYLYDLNLKI
jgi:hypothetical protein